MRLLASLAVLTATLATSPALAQGQGRAPIRGGVLLGFEDGDGPAGVALRFDGEFVQKQIAPGVGLSIVGSVGYSRFSDDGGALDYYWGYDTRWESSLSLFKFVPAARFTFGSSQIVRPYVDAGIGLYYASWSMTQNDVVYDPYNPPYYYSSVEYDYDDSEVGLMLRLAGGINFQVTPGFYIGGELGITPYLGDVGDDTTVSLMAAAQFRL